MEKNKDDFAEVDKFLDLYKSKRPETVYLIKNKERYDAICKAIETISGYVKDISPDAKIETDNGAMDECAICLKVTTDEVIIQDIKGFCEALLEASNMEFYPTKRGEQVMAIMFRDAYEFAPPYGTKQL